MLAYGFIQVVYRVPVTIHRKLVFAGHFNRPTNKADELEEEEETMSAHETMEQLRKKGVDGGLTDMADGMKQTVQDALGASLRAVDVDVAAERLEQSTRILRNARILLTDVHFLAALHHGDQPILGGAAARRNRQHPPHAAQRLQGAGSERAGACGDHYPWVLHSVSVRDMGVHLSSEFFATGEVSPTSHEIGCQTAFHCLVYVTEIGLRQGDVGEALNGIQWGDDRLWAYTIYTLLYFVLVTTILLNVIFGIIIDSFGELRNNRDEISEQMEQECFICGLSRSSFDKPSSPFSFDQHVRSEHNALHYLLFIIYLLEKPETDLTGPEQHVLHLVRRRNCSWIPNKIAVHAVDEDEEDELEHEAMNKSIMEQLSSLRFGAEASDYRLSRLEMKLDSVLDALQVSNHNKGPSADLTAATGGRSVVERLAL
eukprot:CAMPEP_0175894738 /NCGR_PEP_ID=MMETSP0107_2-20121207/50148_1 /TAXON_ID=195067 ORGANISM="Goniomonas pacifica, Strain CCMP1869" /NCGR_SAMPLE_ID=MMETSP0107_2 /ASSEMBLY_ACC=CAM_ASM_000203 /LENGTH=427 /DNA_ID=CAMNT_0017215843 /DNA_START=87 /DNA_END=1371 /DNA_ORIENTATION=+